MPSKNPKSVHKIIPLEPVVSLDSALKQGELAAFNVGADGIVYFVIATTPADSRLAPVRKSRFAPTPSANSFSYRVLGFFDSELTCDILIENEPFSIHHVQPLGEELLLACARSHYRRHDNFDKNGRIYHWNGRFSRDILLGDGIQNLQAAANGEIWTSYFDEGIFGNFGWSDPIGAAGLVAWNALGEKLFQFEPRLGLDAICDCYAMNVESDESVWICYYTNFPLVRLHRRQITGIWNIPVAGSHAFAVSGQHALFTSGYKDEQTCTLLELDSQGRSRTAATVQYQTPDGARLDLRTSVGRGDRLYFFCQNALYRADISNTMNW